MRKRIHLTIIGFFLLLNGSLFAQTAGWGAGLSFGEPTGICVKKWLDAEHAITGSIAYSVATVNNQLSVNANYVWNELRVVGYNSRYGEQYGVGLRICTRPNESPQFGLRLSASFIWYPNKFPCDFFVEGAPVLYFNPYSGVGMDASAGIRFYFSRSNSK